MVTGLKSTLIAALAFSTIAKAGLYNNLKSLLEINQDNYKKQYQSISAQGKRLSNYQNVKLDQDYLSTILFYTPKNFLALGQRDKCSFYDLLLAGLLKDDLNKKVANLIVNQDAQKYLIGSSEFIEKIITPICPNIKNFSKHFEPQNILKTLSEYKINSPTSRKECENLHESFRSDFKSPYLCSINEKIQSIKKLEFRLRNTSTQNYKQRTILIKKIKEAKKYRTKLNPTALSYISKLCTHADSSKMFCSDIFQDNFWSKILTKERSPIYASPFCKLKEGQDSFSNKQKKCILGLANNPQICEKAKISNSLSPILDCKTLSKTLNLAKLKSDYKDCPLLTNNSQITNIGRIINHYRPEKLHTSRACIETNPSAYLKMLEEMEYLSQWRFNLCYEDKIQREKVCYPTLLSNDPKNQYSVTEVVQRILSKTKGMVSSSKCELISEKDYRPILLKYKAGCFIIKPQKCDAIRCRPKIIFNELEVKLIEIQNGISSKYYATKFNEVQYSLSAMLPKYLKLKTKKIFNITALKAIIDKPKGLIHGTGCQEDLLSSFYKRSHFAQCNLISFIIDGYIESDGYLSVSIRTSSDSLQYPRVLSWSRLFNSIKNAQLFQPINEWSLDGLF